MSGHGKDGVMRPVEVLAVEVTGITADTVVRMLGFEGRSALERMRAQPGFPMPRYPTGTSTPRWDAEAVRKWFREESPTVSSERKKYKPRKPKAVAVAHTTEPMEASQ